MVPPYNPSGWPRVSLVQHLGALSGLSSCPHILTTFFQLMLHTRPHLCAAQKAPTSQPAEGTSPVSFQLPLALEGLSVSLAQADLGAPVPQIRLHCVPPSSQLRYLTPDYPVADSRLPGVGTPAVHLSIPRT